MDAVTERVAFPALARPLVAILRGIRPEETAAIVSMLLDRGFSAIEIPLNSPDPFRSIEIAARLAPAEALIGAGTVLEPGDVDRLRDCGGRLLVSPNIDPAVMARTMAAGMVTMPGVFTPTEALLALRCGASALKFFPAGVLGSAGIAAIRAILPPEAVLGAVGGVSDANFGEYAKVGVKVFGLGSSLYRAGMSVADVTERARITIAAYDVTSIGSRD